MTKKDYEIIAYCLNTYNIYHLVGENLEKEIKLKIVGWFAYNLSQGNPKFDTDKFFKACGISNNN